MTPPITVGAAGADYFAVSQIRLERRRRYGVVTVSLHDVEGHIADRFADILRAAGWPRATRSLVIREALLRLHEDLVDNTPEEIFRDFVDRQARRLRGPDRESRR